MAASWAIVEISFIISSYRKATKHFSLGHKHVVICSVFRASDPEKLWISIPLLGTVNELWILAQGKNVRLLVRIISIQGEVAYDSTCCNLIKKQEQEKL